jgi:hypothetical protein
LDALQVATYIANSESAHEVVIFIDYMVRHPEIGFYSQKLLDENDKQDGKLLKPKNKAKAKRLFEELKKEEYIIPRRKREVNPLQSSFDLESFIL